MREAERHREREEEGICESCLRRQSERETRERCSESERIDFLRLCEGREARVVDGSAERLHCDHAHVRVCCIGDGRCPVCVLE